MVEAADATAQNKERASEIFQNIFSQIFLANCGNPIDVNLARSEITKHMKIEFDDQKLEAFEQCFVEADTDNVSKTYFMTSN